MQARAARASALPLGTRDTATETTPGAPLSARSTAEVQLTHTMPDTCQRQRHACGVCPPVSTAARAHMQRSYSRRGRGAAPTLCRSLRAEEAVCCKAVCRIQCEMLAYIPVVAGRRYSDGQ